ncbi:helix-turn-helix domain-containing protein [Denitrobaculum tricleocarpae]|uniref:Helix-turn-helix transcriptional regulator n=1 Tax=Denitrobaculum tricleocarpae TaxID=2591009 RepID=A0A545SZ67_9PROT|nr:helix-turn-helix transcriptional regulator [Denitrobaculum tricleocarpae]TQV70265.1 helix-turn-helix transcriptional regulator [Denitrobaculum tricleocarpae]
MDSSQKNKILNQFVARRLVQYRIHNGMSQERLAKHLGVTPERIRRVESGAQHLEAISLYAACEVFGTSMAAFFKCYKGFEEQYQSRARSSSASAACR